MEQTLKQKTTPKDFFLHLGFLVSFYVLIVTYITFLFSLINTLFPDRQNTYYDPYGTEMRISVSLLIVATPLCILLLRKIHARLREDSQKKDVWLRRWALYVTLFLAIAALAIDLVVLINTFLGGEITTRFLLKALTIIIVGVAVWWYARQEIDNTIALRPKVAQRLGWGLGVLIAASVVVGFSFIGSPTLLRNIRDDNQREADLDNLKYRIVDYYQSKKATLPKTLADINIGNPNQVEIPVDPATEQPYEYRVLESRLMGKIQFAAFELCATFAEDGSVDERIQNQPSVYDVKLAIDNETNFSTHPAGRSCFEITIDPERFPPIQDVPNLKTK